MGIRIIDEELQLVPYYPAYETTLPWYQDAALCKQVDNRDAVYDLALLKRMYTYLNAHGDLFYIQYKGTLCGDVCLQPSGEVNIVVAKPFQNQHIGRRIISELILLAKEKGIPQLHAEIYAFNTQSQRMFQSVGFKKIDAEQYAYLISKEPPMLNHHKATEAEKRELCTWKYEGDYALYDMPSYEEMKARRFGFGSPKMYVETFYDGETLVGFCNLFDDGDEVFFGIGVHPQACGRGYGKEMTEAMYAVSQQLFPGKPLYLEVRTWNERAIRCYKSAGFAIDGDVIHQKTNAGSGDFYRMVRR